MRKTFALLNLLYACIRFEQMKTKEDMHDMAWLRYQSLSIYFHYKSPQNKPQAPGAKTTQF